MAKLMPRYDPAEIRTRSERDVARALVAGLGPECVVYHSYPWLRPERDAQGRARYLREGEADFIVLTQDGFLVLEVKGGVLEYDAERLTWYRRHADGRRERITDPFEQARRSLHVIKDRLLDRQFPGQSALPFGYGYAVVFPDCDYAGALPVLPGGDRAVVFTARDLPDLGRKAADLIRLWNRNPRPIPLTGGQLQRVRDGLAGHFPLMPALHRQLAGQDEQLEQLTEHQALALMGLYHYDRVIVQGTAGSGKTWLALARALRFAEEGRKTLLLCFNAALAAWLRDLIPRAVRPLVKAANFHELCREWCGKARLAFKEPSEEAAPEEVAAFWRDRVPDLLDQALSVVRDRFDALVVDEAQDFHTNWLQTLEFLNAQVDRGPLYLFYDPEQVQFLEEKPLFPRAEFTYKLPTNCRNTRAIARCCGTVLDRVIPTRPGAPAGDEPCLRASAAPEQRRRWCEDQVGEWLRVPAGLKPSQIAVVGPWRLERSCLAGATSLAGVPVVGLRDQAAWRAGQGILYATVRSFKGLEADALVLVDAIAPAGKAFSSYDYFVACSRAKHLLTILADSTAALPGAGRAAPTAGGAGETESAG